MKLIDALASVSNLSKEAIKNSNVIAKIANWASINEDAELEMLGSEGSYGIAVDIGNDRALKITSDKHEAKVSAALIGLAHKNVAEIYKVAQLTDIRGIKTHLKYKFDVFLILQKKYLQLKYEEKQVINNLPADIESSRVVSFSGKFYVKPARIGEWQNAKDFLKRHFELFQLEYSPYNIDFDYYFHIASQIMNGLSFLAQNSITYSDIHALNTVKDNQGNIVMIDFGGGSKTEIDKKNIDILEKFIRTSIK